MWGANGSMEAIQPGRWSTEMIAMAWFTESQRASLYDCARWKSLERLPQGMTQRDIVGLVRCRPRSRTSDSSQPYASTALDVGHVRRVTRSAKRLGRWTSTRCSSLSPDWYRPCSFAVCRCCHSRRLSTAICLCSRCVQSSPVQSCLCNTQSSGGLSCCSCRRAGSRRSSL